MMSNSALLEAVTQKPVGTPTHSVIWLHGLGADGYDFADVVPMLGLPDSFQSRFIFPHAPVRPVTLNQGMQMRAWYDLHSLEDRSFEDEQGIRESAKLVKAWVDHEAAIVGSKRVFVIGFSQGGAMAAYCALRHPEALAGCAILSGYVCMASTLSDEKHQANLSLPIYMAHGTQDPVVQFQFAQKSHHLLEDQGYSVQFESYPMAHNVSLEEMRSLGKWMSVAA